MQDASDLANRITVRHRGPGFLNLAIPPELIESGLAGAVKNELATQPGIAHVVLDEREKWLAIRFDTSSLSTAQVARQLFLSMEKQLGMQAHDAPAGQAVPPLPAPYDFGRDGLQPWLDKIKAALIPAAPAEEGSLRARFQPVLESALTEKAITNFFNDIVAFYLIKMHWDLITKRWIKEPAAFGNAWLTVFYLIFLLIRYRKSP